MVSTEWTEAGKPDAAVQPIGIERSPGRMNSTDQAATGCDTLALRRTLIALLLFGVSFGYVEAAIVVYLRALYDPMRQRIHPDVQPDELFPLIRFDELKGEGAEHVRQLATEIVREAATLVLLTAMALAVARNAVSYTHLTLPTN